MQLVKTSGSRKHHSSHQRKELFKHITKKHNAFSIKIDKLGDSTGYTYDMKSVLGEGMPTQGTFDSNICHSDSPDRKVKGHTHKL